MIWYDGAWWYVFPEASYPSALGLLVAAVIMLALFVRRR